MDNKTIDGVVPTWSALREKLGLEKGSDAAELVRRMTAQTRHEARTTMVQYVAHHGVIEMAPEMPLREAKLAEWAILTADVIGVGGELGLEGAATLRHPSLRGIGKGRKHASDGGAWNGAIWSAARELHEELSEDGEEPQFAVVEGHLVALSPCVAGAVDLRRLLPTQWRLAITGIGLKAACGIYIDRGIDVDKGMFDVDPETSENGCPVADWAALYDSISAEIRAEKARLESPEPDVMIVPADTDPSDPA